MEYYTEGCLICGEPLVYFEPPQSVVCHICGKPFKTNSFCKAGHFVCDDCHSKKGKMYITQYAIETLSLNPIEIATEMMKYPAINMHGPEHHYLVAASLLAAYKNAGVSVDIEEDLQKILQRAENVPGGICGMWGSCGAAISTGIFISVITGATPLSEKEWSYANKMTSNSLNIISENGGPRCCKRNSYIAIKLAVEFIKELFNISLELPEQIVCNFSYRNDQCRLTDCLFFSNNV